MSPNAGLTPTQLLVIVNNLEAALDVLERDGRQLTSAEISGKSMLLVVRRTFLEEFEKRRELAEAPLLAPERV